MGEAKRRKDLGIPPRLKKNQKNQSERLISWLPITKKQLSKISLCCSSYHGYWIDTFIS